MIQMPAGPNFPPGPPSCLALTMGDPSGIGPELTLKAWQHFRLTREVTFAAYADPDALRTAALRLGLDVPVCEIDSTQDAPAAFADSLPCRSVPLRKPAIPGGPDSANATAIIQSIEAAVTDTISGAADAVVTNPIAKAVLYEAGFSHPGHTEFLGVLSERLTGEPVAVPVMLLACDQLMVVPVTIHIPLRDVPDALTPHLIETTVDILHASLQRDFGLSAPRIAVAGLNPHAGESGTIGSEETDTIIPALEALMRRGLQVAGPCPADTLFHDEARRDYDAAVCMYHDQALIPIKTLAFDLGVNITLGLPFIRTSPDHGTAFDIAGQGVARPTSLIEAMKRAAQMARMRSAFVGVAPR